MEDSSTAPSNWVKNTVIDTYSAEEIQERHWLNNYLNGKLMTDRDRIWQDDHTNARRGEG